MNKLFFIISIIIYILNYIVINAFNIDTSNSLWSAIFFIILLSLLCTGCLINSIIYSKKNSALRFLFYYFSFMCSFGILLVSILSSFILKSTKQCLTILIFYALLSLSSVIGYFISRNHDYKLKKVFGYFSILFSLSLLIDIVLTIIQTFK